MGGCVIEKPERDKVRMREAGRSAILRYAISGQSQARHKGSLHVGTVSINISHTPILAHHVLQQSLQPVKREFAVP